MTLHIGIVACSAEGAALCYRIICSEGAKLLGPHAHPEISMHSPPLNQYVDFLDRDDLRGVAALMLGSANKLAQMGADFLICPDNTIHQAMSFVTPESPLPWLHIAEVTAAEAAARGYRRLGLTGTRWLVESDVYPKKPSEHGLEHLRPNANEVKEIDLIIMEELVPGTIKPEAVSYFRKVFERMKEAKCDAVILGCTEIPLVMNEANSPLPSSIPHICWRGQPCTKPCKAKARLQKLANPRCGRKAAGVVTSKPRRPIRSYEHAMRTSRFKKGIR